MQTDRPTVRPLLKSRLRAVLAAHERSFSALAAACGVTPRHLDLVLAGDRPLAPRLADALRQELGEGEYAFVTGQCSQLSLAEQEGK
jgi:hypothetical protein